jgi:hypothetical protein
MADESIQINFTGNATSLQHAAQQVSQSLNQVAANTKSMSATTVAAGTAMGSIMVQMGQKALGFAKDAVGSFSSVASEVRKMQGIMGGSAEDVSRLRFAAEEVGVSAETVSKSFRMLSTHLVTHDKAAQAVGVSYKNLDGSMKAPQELLGQVADQLNKLPAGAERSALAAKLFGRGFAELNPLLKQGSEGIKKFAEESDILGLTMSQKDVDAAKAMTMANRELHAVIKGVFVEIGRTVMPTLAAFATTISHGALQIKNFINEHQNLGTAIKIMGGIVAGVATVILQYFAIQKGVAAFEAGYATLKGIFAVATVAEATATEGATVAQWGLNAAMDANPIGVIVLALEVFVAALIILVKSFKPVQDALIWVFTLIGNVGGKAIAIFVKYLEFMGVAYINLARIAVKAGEIITGNRFWKAIFGGGANEAVKGALDAMDSFEAKFKSIADGIAKNAWDNGGTIGKNLGQGLVNGIKNLKLPSLKVPKTADKVDNGLGMPDISLLDSTPDNSAALAAAEKAAYEKKLEATKDFWDKRIKIAKDAFDYAKGIADKAKADMAQIASSVAQSITSGFDITALTQSSFAKYLGADALVASFRKKLTDAKEFVADLQALKAQGLPVEMLQQMAAAGVEGGLDAARVLVGNTGAIQELAALQAELNIASGQAGETVSVAVKGQDVLAATSAQTTARAGLTTEERGAGAAGVVVNETTSANGDVNITVQTVTNASPSDIADSIAFAIITNTPAVTPTATPVDLSNVDWSQFDFSNIDLSGFSVGGLATFV